MDGATIWVGASALHRFPNLTTHPKSEHRSSFSLVTVLSFPLSFSPSCSSDSTAHFFFSSQTKALLEPKSPPHHVHILVSKLYCDFLSFCFPSLLPATKIGLATTARVISHNFAYTFLTHLLSNTWSDERANRSLSFSLCVPMKSISVIDFMLAS